MRKLTTLVFILLFTAGMAYGQNQATTTQDGTANEVVIEQVYAPGVSTGVNKAVVTQEGNYNKVKRLSQYGAGNRYDVTQVGDYNIIRQFSEQGVSAYPSWDGTIVINQTGAHNLVWDTDQAGLGNELYLTQNGDYNEANIEGQVGPDNGANNIMTITQTGNGNRVGVSTKKGSGAYQEGSDNSMTITQSGGASAGIKDYLPASGDYNNFGKFFRSGIEGGQGLIQLGSDNVMTITQNGASVVGYAHQEGTANILTIKQTGVGHYATSVQIGTGNIATIIQN